jgi:leucyl-tRNA synthetase
MMDENQSGEWELSPHIQEIAPDKSQLKLVHATIKKVTEDIESLSFNTAISQMMVFVNAFTNAEKIPVTAMRTLLVLLNPFAPHLTSELWEILAGKFQVDPANIAQQTWPEYDEALLIEDEVEIVVQINGKMRARLKVAADAKEETLKAAALVLPKIAESVSGKEILKVVIVRSKLVNIVTN